ncbi:hypothetical protein JCM10296v2_000844 [Rhodotorula toruloides]
MEEERVERVREVERLERREEERVRREGGEDEEPGPIQLALMTRLHSTLSSSPNPSLLELRILANHSKDERFAFLREGGRWRSVWGELRRGERGVDGRRKEIEQGKAVAAKKEGLAGLVGYGSDSDDEEEQEQTGGRAEPERAAGADEAVASLADLDPTPGPTATAEEATADGDLERRAKQALKAEKAREWARKRREAREAREAAGATESAAGS